MAKIRARARAVDMLGRQQIAGIQNAVSELFKNAHDAYANHVAVDYFEDIGGSGEGLLVIRDDGFGMTLDDFENKWLVLGTDSKTASGRANAYRPPDVPSRPITGEKGIGRLAIALLGRQVLVMTRAQREDGSHDLVVSLVHWGLYELPGLNLDDIEIPIASFSGGVLPTVQDVRLLKDKVLESIQALDDIHASQSLKQIIVEIERFAPDPIAMDAFFKTRETDHLSLTNARSGTHFLIGPSNPVLKIEIDWEIRQKDYSFRKQLLGFTDRTFSDEPSIPLATSFRRWLPGDLFGEDLLEIANFFTRDELTEKSDHLLSGVVDPYGQFSGSLRIYEKDYPNITIPWPQSGGVKTECGPFKVIFGYLMGRNSESIVPGVEFNALNTKLDYLGGMYVYRDRVRILPYGDHSFDWLDVEKRRNKGAGYYFFSFRRMFGAVLLTLADNDSLQEKAGREGFQQNRSYRELRDILQNLLIQLAAEFFRKGTEQGDLFEKRQTEIKSRVRALERRQKQVTSRRKEFSDQLARFNDNITTKLPEAEIDSLRRLTQSRMESAASISDQDKAAAALIRAEQDALRKLDQIKTVHLCRKPSGVALGKDLTKDWDAYLAERARLESQVFGPFEAEVGRTLGAVATQARLYVDQRKRLVERLSALGDQRKKDLAEASRLANSSATETRQTVLDITERARLALEQTIKGIEGDLNRTNISNLQPEQIEKLQKKWEAQVTDVENRHRDALLAARDMLASLAENLRSSDGEAPAQVMEALEDRMLALEEQADEDFEMVQLGLAVAIINHEFSASIRRVRKSLQELGHISRRTDSLKPLYESIRSNFEHLDGHLNLFTPLQKRLYRTAQTISGKSVYNYVQDLFSNRFERHKVSVEHTPGFMSATVECYPSTLYPAVINLVDNAMYWLMSAKAERIIRFDVVPGAIIISNTGPSIDERDFTKIFERGFSRKPGGRGLGLFISAKALEAEHMSLSVDEPPSGFSAAFRISIPTLKMDL
jgi:signal transduction histidine kinase